MRAELLTERQVEDRYDLSIAWLRRARRERRGPVFLKIGRMVRYRKADIEAYLASRVVGTHEHSRSGGES